MSQRPTSRIYASPFTAKNQVEVSTGFQTSRAVQASGTPGEVLGIGTGGDLEFVRYGVAPASSTVNEGDIIIGDASGNETSLSVGTAGQILVSNGTTLAYQDNATPDDIITTRGDIIYGNATADADRLPVGTSGQVLGTDGTDVFWTAAGTGASVPAGANFDVITLSGGGLAANTSRAVMATDRTTGTLSHTGTQSVVIASAVDTGQTLTVAAARSSAISVFRGGVGGTATISANQGSCIATTINGSWSQTGRESCLTSTLCDGSVTVSCPQAFMAACNVQSTGDARITGTDCSFMIGSRFSGGLNIVSGSRSGFIACDNSTANSVIHNQAVVMCSTNRSSVASNTLHVDNLNVAGTFYTSDKTVKAFVRRNAREDETAAELCAKFCSVETKEYRLKKMGRTLRGFDADELNAVFPEAVQTTYFETHVVIRESVLEPWVEAEDTDLVFTQEEVEVDDDNEQTGYVFREHPQSVKAVDPMAIQAILWTVCKKQMELITALQTDVAALEAL